MTDVQLWIDGKMMARTVPNISRPDVALHFNNEAIATSGWQFVCAAPANFEAVVLNVVSNLGMENILLPT